MAQDTLMNTFWDNDYPCDVLSLSSSTDTSIIPSPQNNANFYTDTSPLHNPTHSSPRFYLDSSPVPSPAQNYANFSLDTSPLRSPSQSSSGFSSDTTPIPSPTYTDSFQYLFSKPLVEQCSSYEYKTGIPSPAEPTYTSLEPVAPLYDARDDVPRKTAPANSREQNVHVFQVTPNEFCARLGSFNYTFDVNETFETSLDFSNLSRDIPVPAIERTYSPACTAPSQRRQTTGTGRNRKLPRAERLWEFILRLLLDSTYNPSYIEWVDRERGMFRLVNSRQIARMWGKRKNNFDMTYEKLSRAMRYYYHRKILQPVFGKKLVYKFGPNSTGWQLQERRNVFESEGA